MEDETDLSAQQDQTKAKVRLPLAHENDVGQESDQPQKTRRSKKARRLTKRGEFQRISREGRRLVGKFLCIDVRSAPFSRFGITASKRFGNAPERNRFKRLVREAFRASIPPSVEINVLPRQKAKGAKLSDIQDEMLQLLS